MKRNIKLKGQLRVYMQWPLIMLALLVGMNIWIYTVDGNAGLILSTFIAIYGIAVGVLYSRNKYEVFTEQIGRAHV